MNFSGAKRESDKICYMVKFEGEQDSKILSSLDAEKYAVGIIDFLQSKIQWEDDKGNGSTTAVLVEPRNADSKVICMKYFKLYIRLIFNQLLYFFRCNTRT